MYVAKICLKSVPGGPFNFILGGWHYDDPPTIVITQYWVVVSSSYLEANTRKTPPPTSGAQNGCHGNTGCLATAPRNLHFMIEYIKNAKAHKLQTRHISSRCRSGYMIQMKVGQISRSYRHIMCLGKICHNSITGGQINFILGSRHEDDPQRVRRKMVAIATTVA